MIQNVHQESKITREESMSHIQKNYSLETDLGKKSLQKMFENILYLIKIFKPTPPHSSANSKQDKQIKLC